MLLKDLTFGTVVSIMVYGPPKAGARRISKPVSLFELSAQFNWIELLVMGAKFKLEQNYPNPFNPDTIIQYSIPNIDSDLGVNVIIKVYDVQGKEVKTLVNKSANSGLHEIKFDGSTLTSGIYYYTIESDGFSQAKKMLMIK